jgi:hypothetical protein
MIGKTALPVIIFASLALLSCSVLHAQQPSAADEATETRTGSINGKVINENGQPLANAVVYIRTYGLNGIGRTTLTDSDGAFQVSGLDPLAYIVSATLPAYITAPRDPDSPQAAYFRIGDSVRLELIKGGIITGTITSSSGDVVVGVRVRAYMIRDETGQPARYEMPSRERTTDDRGVYRIYGLGAGTYVVAAGGSGGFWDYNLSPFDSDVPTYAPASTRDTAQEINLHRGEEANNIDIRYRGEPGHKVSGTASGGLGPGAYNVRLSSISNGAPQTGTTTFQPPGGRGFSFSGIANGDYDLSAESFNERGEAAISDYRRIKVKGADVTGVELTTKPLGSIAGHILLEESKAPECKGKRQPLFAETLVTPWHNEKNIPKDQPPYFWGFGSPVVPDKRGDFILRNLAPGQYRFNMRSPAKYWYVQSISFQPAVAPAAKAAAANRPVDATRNWTTLKPGDRLSALVITLAAGAGSFHGQIKLAEDQKLSRRLFAYLVPAERDAADDVLRFFASQVAADGTFAINNLPPGRYRALVKAAPENESNILAKLRLPDETEARAKLRTEAEVGHIEIELKPCQNISDYQLSFTPH